MEFCGFFFLFQQHMQAVVIIRRNNATPIATPVMSSTLTWRLYLASGELLLEFEKAKGIVTVFLVDSGWGAAWAGGGDMVENMSSEDGEDVEDGKGGLNDERKGDFVGGEDSAAITAWNGGKGEDEKRMMKCSKVMK